MTLMEVGTVTEVAVEDALLLVVHAVQGFDVVLERELSFEFLIANGAGEVADGAVLGHVPLQVVVQQELLTALVALEIVAVFPVLPLDVPLQVADVLEGGPALLAHTLAVVGLRLFDDLRLQDGHFVLGNDFGELQLVVVLRDDVVGVERRWFQILGDDCFVEVHFAVVLNQEIFSIILAAVFDTISDHRLEFNVFNFQWNFNEPLRLDLHHRHHLLVDVL